MKDNSMACECSRLKGCFVLLSLVSLEEALVYLLFSTDSLSSKLGLSSSNCGMSICLPNRLECFHFLRRPQF